MALADHFGIENNELKGQMQTTNSNDGQTLQIRATGSSDTYKRWIQTVTSNEMF